MLHSEAIVSIFTSNQVYFYLSVYMYFYLIKFFQNYVIGGPRGWVVKVANL